MIRIKDLKFTYPGENAPALSVGSLHIKKGEFAVLCGPSGCGKTTLLRLLKPSLSPNGEKTGEISTYSLNDACDIGFVQQSPENQIVTDKVWHELVFGMESLGYDNASIRKRAAEMAEFFGMESWFYKNVTELSGGQKQLLNLAAVMTLNPKILLLDEPTSMLDPIASKDFINMLARINRELGVTVLLSEHRLEDAFPHADRCVMMSEGSVIYDGHPSKMPRERIYSSMPAPMRIWASIPGDEDTACPLTVKEGRELLENKQSLIVKKSISFKEKNVGEVIYKAEDVCFRYEKNLPFVLSDLSMEIHKGEFVAVLGGNGTGKTTALKMIAGLYDPASGSITKSARAVLLPQDPSTLFTKNTVMEELYESAKDEAVAMDLAEKFGLTGLINRHPFDISGGEQQRLAIAKCIIKKPELLLLDEPTKGIDGTFKKKLASILYEYLSEGGTIVMVSHDTEFTAEYTSRCLMFFDGHVITEDTPKSFFSGNKFYTTSESLMSRGLIENAATVEDVLFAYGIDTKPLEYPEVKTDCTVKTGDSDDKSILPLWRKITAGISGVAALIIIFIAFANTKLSDLISGDGVTSLTMKRLPLYGLLILSLVIMMLAVGNKKKGIEPERRRNKLTKRTKVTIMTVFALVPATLITGWVLFGGRQYYLIALIILLECFAPFIMVFEGRKPKPRELVLIAVTAALAIAGRTAFFALPGFTPVMAVAILAGAAFGAESGFMTGAVAMLVSNFFFGQGPWTPWQMFAMGLIGFLGGIIPAKNKVSLSVFGLLTAVIIYGGIMNGASALMWDRTGETVSLLVYYIAGLPVDLVHAASTFIFLWFFADSFLEKTDRIKTKYGLY
ncbi:MAG: ATP-binding cassette domain-containing protein [Eubacteriales bacterium]|nr:ATP-binding cassette domain-containing protein [Eubacteriales bacterium]